MLDTAPLTHPVAAVRKPEAYSATERNTTPCCRAVSEACFTTSPFEYASIRAPKVFWSGSED